MKAKRKSAGLLLFRFSQGEVQLFLVHPGGPFWANRDEGTWTIPKGELNEGEEPLEAAIREFKEETGTAVSGKFIELKPVIQKGGKMVYAWAIEGDIDADKIQCNTFKVQWPPGSGKWKAYPEIDRAAWFSPEQARQKINAAQIPLIDELVAGLTGTNLL